MRGHQTYTLTSILNTSQMRPQLYQQILHELKSPLGEVSVDLTHDNSLEGGPPRRPNIPPAPPKSPLNRLGDCSFSRTHESASLAACQTPRQEHFHDEVMESLLSPLDQQVSFKEEPRAPPFLCGALLDSVAASENGFEIELPPRSRLYKRKPIFQGKQAARPSRTAEQVVATLQEMGEERMATFFQLLRDLDDELCRVSLEREEAKKCLEAIFERLSGDIELVSEQEESLATYRILRRLRSRNTFELVAKLVREEGPERAAQAERRLEMLLQSLGRLEAITGRFMERREALEVLEEVYESLQQAFPHERTLVGQLQRLCEGFGCRLELRGVEFVWREGERRRVSHEEFVEGVAMNDCVVRLPRSFEEELQLKGFRRN